MRKEGAEFVLQGIGEGHGIGLCQAGAKAMAKAGADFREVLTHYYPNTLDHHPRERRAFVLIALCVHFSRDEID